MKERTLYLITSIFLSSNKRYKRPSKEVMINKHKHACMLNRFSHVRFCTTLWTGACQVCLSMGFSRQEYWSGLPCPPPGDLPDQGIKPGTLTSPALAGKLFPTGATWGAQTNPCYLRSSAPGHRSDSSKDMQASLWHSRDNMVREKAQENSYKGK